MLKKLFAVVAVVAMLFCVAPASADVLYISGQPAHTVIAGGAIAGGGSLVFMSQGAYNNYTATPDFVSMTQATDQTMAGGSLTFTGAGALGYSDGWINLLCVDGGGFALAGTSMEAFQAGGALQKLTTPTMELVQASFGIQAARTCALSVARGGGHGFAFSVGATRVFSCGGRYE